MGYFWPGMGPCPVRSNVGQLSPSAVNSHTAEEP